MLSWNFLWKIRFKYLDPLNTLLTGLLKYFPFQRPGRFKKRKRRRLVSVDRILAQRSNYRKYIKDKESDEDREDYGFGEIDDSQQILQGYTQELVNVTQ